MLWGVQQEVAAVSAERRAAKYNRPIDSAVVTQLDWTTAKRPLKQVINLLNGTPVKYLILIAREKDLYKELPDGSNIKIGVQPDIIKGADYEVNLALHFGYDEQRKWFAEVTKVQGKLGQLFPYGTRLTEFPMKALTDYTAVMEPEKIKPVITDDALANNMVAEDAKKAEYTEANLIKYAKTLGFDGAAVRSVLSTAGFTRYEPAKYEEMAAALAKAAKWLTSQNV